MKSMSVQDLIDQLQAVPDKRQVVVVCIKGVEVGETIITEVSPEKPDGQDDPEHIGVCWLRLPEHSSVHVE